MLSVLNHLAFRFSLMFYKIPFTVAFNTLLVITSGIIVFHFLVLTGLIPYLFVWGGRLRTPEEMMRFEIVSLFINIFFLLVLYLKIKRHREEQTTRWANGLLWAFGALYSLNTLANLAAVSSIETLVFTPLTLILALFTVRVALEK